VSGASPGSEGGSKEGGIVSVWLPVGKFDQKEKWLKHTIRYKKRSKRREASV